MTGETYWTASAIPFIVGDVLYTLKRNQQCVVIEQGAGRYGLWVEMCGSLIAQNSTAEEMAQALNEVGARPKEAS